MIRLLHTADLHLDSPLRSLALRDPDLPSVVAAATRAALERIVDVAIAEDVSALLICGDLFDGKERSAKTVAFLIAQFERLDAAGIRVFTIKGNHDAEHGAFGKAEMPPNVHSFTARGGKVALTDDIWIHGVSFADRRAPESLLPKFGPPVAGAFNIAMLHTSLAGAAGHDTYAPCSVTDLIQMGFDYWALGHIHRRQVHAKSPWVVMPGTPQGRDIGEAGPKTASLITLDAGEMSVEEIPTAQVEFCQSDIDITHTADISREIGEGLARIRSNLTAPSGVVRLTLRGEPTDHWQILRDKDLWQERAEDMARRTGNLWLDKLILDLRPPQTQTAETTTASDELAALMQTLSRDPGFQHAALAEVEALLSDVPQVRARMAPDPEEVDALRDETARDGAARMIAAIKGADT